MSEEGSEKRFHSVMDKLFNSPNPKSISRSQGPRGKKRGNSEANDSGRESGLSRSLVLAGTLSSKAPLCRPWDRGDLMRRLSTFKSMTWFGKPKVISAVNCARRGWINVEMDIIACEACGARLLFSNPSSWTRQQIEKAAAVFSLKLDNGHKILCPWIDNACDESLAQFPPTDDPVLIDGYRKRFSSLLQLSALPVISSSAIDSKKCRQLESFLEQSSVDFGLGSVESTRIEYLYHERAASADLYYKALKLISLCGWEPRLLHYAVDCEDWLTQTPENGHSEPASRHIVNSKSPGVVMHSKSCSDHAMDVEEDPSLNALQFDPASVVLDCKLCGATAGLWAFNVVSRPLEWFRVVESLEINGHNGNIAASVAGSSVLDKSDKDNHTGHNGGIVDICTSNKGSLSLNLSIAGGPSPEKQNYRATVSFPIISRHLRAELSSSFDARNHLSNASSVDCELIQPNAVNTNTLHQENDPILPGNLITQYEDMGISTQKNNEDGVGVPETNGLSCLIGSSPRNAENVDASLDFVIRQDVRDAPNRCSVSENPPESSQQMPQDNDKIYESGGTTENADCGFGDDFQQKECNANVPDATNNSVRNLKLSGNDPCVVSPAEDPIHQVAEHPTVADQSVSSNLEQNTIVEAASTKNLRNGDIGSNHQRLTNLEGTIQKIVEDPKRVELGQLMEFDPIRQHRHFCPWILSNRTGPGWRATLSALDRQKASSHSSLPDSPSSSMFKADDPITAIRNLFTSPSAKRIKISHSR